MHFIDCIRTLTGRKGATSTLHDWCSDHALTKHSLLEDLPGVLRLGQWLIVMFLDSHLDPGVPEWVRRDRYTIGRGCIHRHCIDECLRWHNRQKHASCNIYKIFSTPIDGTGCRAFFWTCRNSLEEGPAKKRSALEEVVPPNFQRCDGWCWCRWHHCWRQWSISNSVTYILRQTLEGNFWWASGGNVCPLVFFIF